MMASSLSTRQRCALRGADSPRSRPSLLIACPCKAASHRRMAVRRLVATLRCLRSCKAASHRRMAV